MNTESVGTGKTAGDRRTEEWAIGLRIGLAIAEGASEILRRAGRVDVLDEEGRVIFSSPIRDLPGLVEEREEEA